MAKIRFDVNRHLKIIEKIPVLSGLSVSQMQKVLQAGHLVVFPPGDVLCREGENSRTMFILLTGELLVKKAATEIARIKPVDIIGEMGVVTNMPRSASVEVLEKANVILIPKLQMDALLKNDIDMAARIYKNMLDAISRKLRSTNQRLVGDEELVQLL